jgi:serine O-acetyltransferase
MHNSIISSIKAKDLANYVHRQISLFFPDDDAVLVSDFEKYVDNALDKIEFCFRHVDNKYYTRKDGKVLFNHLNGDHYSTFLYFLSNIIWLKSEDGKIPSKIFLLNKALHGIDLFYEVVMPDIFLLVHPIGTVLGRASYSDYLVIYQGCTIGSITDMGFPTIGKNLTMYSNSSLLGNCRVDDNVTIGANSYAVNSKIDNNSVVVGQYPELKIKKKKNSKSIFFK